MLVPLEVCLPAIPATAPTGDMVRKLWIAEIEKCGEVIAESFVSLHIVAGGIESPVDFIRDNGERSSLE